MKPVLSKITKAFCLPWTQYAQWLYWAISSSNFVVNSKLMLKESLIILEQMSWMMVTNITSIWHIVLSLRFLLLIVVPLTSSSIIGISQCSKYSINAICNSCMGYQKSSFQATFSTKICQMQCYSFPGNNLRGLKTTCTCVIIQITRSQTACAKAYLG